MNHSLRYGLLDQFYSPQILTISNRWSANYAIFQIILNLLLIQGLTLVIFENRYEVMTSSSLALIIFVLAH